MRMTYPREGLILLPGLQNKKTQGAGLTFNPLRDKDLLLKAFEIGEGVACYSAQLTNTILFIMLHNSDIIEYIFLCEALYIYDLYSSQK